MSSGNVTTAQATRNAIRLAERLGLALPVAEGSATPRVGPPHPPSHAVHGPEGFGDVATEAPAGRAVGASAAEFLCRLAEQHAGELVVCPIGPMTDIAAALDLDPGFARHVREIVFMGGALDVAGNITPHAEANAYHDPHALDVVLASGAPLTMVGLDVTMRALLGEAHFDYLAELNPQHGGFLREISQFYLRFYRSKGLPGCGLHDPMAIIAALDPSLFSVETTPVAAVLEGAKIGQTHRATGRPSIRVCLDCNTQEVVRTFFKAFGPVEP